MLDAELSPDDYRELKEAEKLVCRFLDWEIDEEDGDPMARMTDMLQDMGGSEHGLDGSEAGDGEERSVAMGTMRDGEGPRRSLTVKRVGRKRVANETLDVKQEEEEVRAESVYEEE